ncbi:unnamed protein product [Nesidiocoris tenuis]|uniref:Uncharacterized protein n=1 Tax=Nesidiocoris tenuis TaxID=355587 RepID=A0A6H5GNA6_9HEMI|nr:unnamed protein product [Nesidiocoris tenuis]
MFKIFFLALAIACVFAVEDQRVKKDVLLGSPYAYSAGYVASPYAAYAAPAAYSAYAAPAYSAYAAPAAYSAYSAYPYAASAYRAGLYY